MVFGQVVHFFQMLLALENSVEMAYKAHCQQTMLLFEQMVNFL